MAERRTEITINVYSGVPFDNKYENVLFVDTDNLAEFLSHYEIGSDVTSNRFEIIDDTQAIVDLTNDFECMNANYCKVHRKIMPETNEDTYEYDAYYFVTRARQIATNVIRLYLELDVFQTQFNKYDYNGGGETIPEIKKSLVAMSTNSDVLSHAGHYYSPIPFEKFNDLTTYTPFTNFTLQNKNFYFVFKYIEENAGVETIALVTRYHTQNVTPDRQQFFDIFQNLGETSTPTTNYTVFSELCDILRDTLKIYDTLNNSFNITLLGFYMIPVGYIDNTLFSNIETNTTEIRIKKNASDTYYYVARTFNGKTKDIIYSTTVTPTPYKQTFVGSLSKNIPLEYNGNSYDVSVKISISNDFVVRLEADNQIIDVTDAFELSLTNSDYGSYMQQNETGFAIKNISKAILSVAGIASGNPLSLLTATQTVADFASEYGKIADLKKQPPKIESKASSGTGMSTFVCVGIIENEPINVDDITDAIKFTGYSMSSLQDITFEYIDRPIQNVRYNFDYYKFSNVNIVGKIPLNFKEQIENMFLRGIRIWYNPAKFLQTIENKENVT